jgi:hypothetical protein
MAKFTFLTRAILPTRLLLGCTLLVAPFWPARAANGCGLPARLYEQRKSVEMLSDAQREIDHTYVEFMKAVAQSYAKRDAEAVKACCDTVKEDPVGFQFCALIRYLLSDRKEPDSFLAAMPATKQQREALWLMEMISAGGTMETPTSLPGIRMPDGLLFKFVDEIFGLVKKGNETAAEKYLFLYDDADGEFGEYMDDQLPKLFLNYPQQVLALWPVFKKHHKRLEMMRGFTTERRIVAKYKGLCKTGDSRCAEIRDIFVEH